MERPQTWRLEAAHLAQDTYRDRRGNAGVRAVEVTTSNVGNAPMLPGLLDQIPPDQNIGSVTAPSHACKHALPGSGWGLRHAQMPRRDCGSQCPCCHSATQEREAVEAYKRRSHRPERGSQRVAIPWPSTLAAIERIPPPEPRRNEDELCEAIGAKPHGEGLRSAGRGSPSPHRRLKPLHGPWNTRHRGRRISPSGERGSLPSTRFV